MRKTITSPANFCDGMEAVQESCPQSKISCGFKTTSFTVSSNAKIPAPSPNRKIVLTSLLHSSCRPIKPKGEPVESGMEAATIVLGRMQGYSVAQSSSWMVGGTRVLSPSRSLLRAPTSANVIPQEVRNRSGHSTASRNINILPFLTPSDMVRVGSATRLN
jgi:hypothetical protein